VRIAVGFFACLLLVGCSHFLELSLRRIETGQGTERIRYYVGSSDGRGTFDKVLLYVGGTSQEPATRDFGNGVRWDDVDGSRSRHRADMADRIWLRLRCQPELSARMKAGLAAARIEFWPHP
jgi:hypothetical protein